MTILGWVTVGVGYAMATYLWYMCVCFWQLLREASADTRRVARALASLPTTRFKAKTAAASEPLLPGGEQNQDAGESCAICLSEYEDGEELRVLPCKHVFRRECIDSWIMRQGISASCPLCKQLIVPSFDAAQEASGAATTTTDAAAAAAGPSTAEAASSAGEPLAGSVAPLDARLAQPAASSTSDSAAGTSSGMQLDGETETRDEEAQPQPKAVEATEATDATEATELEVVISEV